MGLFASTTELWQIGVVHQPRCALLTPGALANARITWLPEPGSFRFHADPFGIFHDGKFTVLAEALDYRTKRGEIHYYTYDAEWNLERQGLAMAQPFHLSYPTLIRDGAEIYLLPEAHKSGKLTLYRAKHFPDQWEEVATLMEQPTIDASVIQHNGTWWMFYALPGENGRAMRELHVAYADALTGPWTQHAMNPVRTALDSARPGGMPFTYEGTLYLPTQDCDGGYGKAINLLRIDKLTSDAFSAALTTRLTPEGVHTQYADGLHTLAGDGGISLIDVKRMDHSPMRALVNLQRRVMRLRARL